MSPCSYINEMATSDIRSLLLIKRKGSIKDGKVMDAATSAGTILSPDATSLADANDHRVSGNDKKRPMRGNDIQSATEHPMFSNSSSYGSCINTANKRSKSEPVNNGHPNTLSYSLAIAKSVHHQLNKSNLKRSNSNNSVGTAMTANTSFNNSYNTHNSSFNVSSISSSNNSASKFNPYLAHPSSQLAVSAPAPMQFLDPNELGMSVENSLSQLKSNFAAASNANNVKDAEAVAALASFASNDAPSVASNNTNSSSTASGMSNRISSVSSFVGGMLSRDDSLINLAMLPTLDNTSNDSESNINRYRSYMLSRDDSLIDLAASVARSHVPNNSGTTNRTNDKSPSSANGSSSFQFIDFPNQS